MRKLSALGFLLITLLLGGCWDKVELESRGFVVSLGIDEAGGAFALAMTLPNVAAIAGKDGGGEAKTILRTQDASLAAAMHNANAEAGQRLSYGHTKMAVFGEECLTNADMLLQATDALERNAELSRKLIILAASGNASDMLDAESPGEPLVGAFVSNYYKNNPVARKLDLEQLLLDLRESDCAILPRIEIDNGAPVLRGAAVLVDARLAGWLDEGEVQGLRWFDGGGEDALLSVDYDGMAVSLRVAQCTRSLSFAENESGGLVCRVRVRASGSVEGLRLGESALLDERTQNELAALYADEITRELKAVFDRFQTDFRADGLHLRRELHKHAPALFRIYGEDWNAAFANMVPEVSVGVAIVR